MFTIVTLELCRPQLNAFSWPGASRLVSPREPWQSWAASALGHPAETVGPLCCLGGSLPSAEEPRKKPKTVGSANAPSAKEIGLA